MKRRRRAIRLARVQDYLCQKVQQQPKGFSYDSVDCSKVSQQVLAARGDNASYLYKFQQMQSNESPQVLTYHQIPLLTLDWNSHTPEQPGTADVNDILAGRANVTLSKELEENIPSVNDMWESFSKTTQDSTTKETSVSDAWQVFLNRPSYNHHSDVPESEWLQTAAYVLPSNNKEPQIQNSEESEEFGEGTDTPNTLQTFAVQLLSDTCETLLADVGLNTKDDQLAEACVSSPGDDKTAVQDQSQRSLTNSATHTPQEFNLKRALHLSNDTADSPMECQRHKDWLQESKGIIRTDGRGESESYALQTPDSVTSSGESETTDMTVMPETPNASNVDTISPDARQNGGVSLCGEREVTGPSHNAVDDIMAFTETIREETKDCARFVFSASSQEEKEEIMMNYTAKNLPTEEEIFRLQQSKACNMPLRYGDKIQSEEFGQNRNREIEENETEAAGGFDSEERTEGNLEKNRNNAIEANKDISSNQHQMKVMEKQAGTVGTQSKETEEATDTSSKLMKILDEVQLQYDDRSSSLPMEEHDTQSSSVQLKRMLHVEKSDNSAPTQIEQYSSQKSKQGQQELSCVRKLMEQKERSPSTDLDPTVETLEVMVCQIRHYTQISCPTERYDLNQLKMVEPLMDSQQTSKSQKCDSSREKNLEKVTAMENGAKRDTPTEDQPETSRGTKQDQSKDDQKVCGGRLKTEAMTEKIENAENPQRENDNAWKEQESSAEAKTSPHVEYNKVADGTRYPITVEDSAALDVTQSGIEQMFIERFGDNLVCSIWEEVFTREIQHSTWHTNTIGDSRNRLIDLTEDCSQIYEKNLSDTYNSGVFSLTEFPADSAVDLCQGLGQPFVTQDNEYSPKDRIPSLTMTEPTDSLYELQTDFDSIAQLSPIVLSKEPMFEPTQSLSSPKDQQNSSQIKTRSVSHQEKDFEKDACIFTDAESFNRSPHLSNKHQSSSEKLKESDALLWWTILYAISHITRLIICTLLVGGFFVVVFLYDFPSFFALYIFSVSWWIFKWKRHQVTTGKKAME